MKERDDKKPLSGIIQLDDAYWGGEKQDSHRMNITTIAYLFEYYRYPYREIKAYS
jgi:hypothetical protein